MQRGRILCPKHLKVFQAERNGVTVRYGYYAGYFHADIMRCPVEDCDMRVITGLGEEIFDPDFEPEISPAKPYPDD